MPPRRSSLVLHDTVDEVFKRIPAHCQSLVQEPRDLVATRNALRLLATKAPVGQFGGQDRAESRAVILLEYIVRDRSTKDGTATLKIKDLCKSLGMKESTFKNLHTTIGHYYPDLTRKFTAKRPALSSQAASKRKESPGGRLVVGAATTPLLQEPQRKSRRGEMPDSILPSLAIRLASHLADPNGVARQSRILFHEIYAHALSCLPTAVDRRGQEHDFRRYWSAYQASVLFYVATKWHKDQPNASSRNREEETAICPLKMEDLIKACCSDCTYMDLKEKLACVEKWVQEIQSKKPQPTTLKKAPREPVSTARTVTAIQTKDSVGAPIEGDDATELDFVTWKESILVTVLEQTRLSVPEDTRDSHDRESLLAMASDAVLAKYGIC